MRILFGLLCCSGLFLTHLSADTIIQYQVINLGSGNWQYTYNVSGNFIQNQEIDIGFSASDFGTLSAPTAPSGWDLSLAIDQPGWCGTGCAGGFLPYYMGSSPSTGGIFTVDATYSGSGQPGAQPFSIVQFDSNGMNGKRIGDPGTTIDPVPEPANMALSGVGLLILAVCRAVQRAARRRA